MTRPVPRPWRKAPLLILLATLCGCASGGRPQAVRESVGTAVAQPLRDVSLIRGEVPDGLRRAAAKPYRPLGDCQAIRAEIAELTGWLGPDVDAQAATPDAAAGMAGEVVSEVASLPFRGVVRRLSGAERRDREAAAVMLGATVRRGFLKGQGAGLGCGER